VSPVPGPSALAAAVSASGLIDGPFVSLGFLPRQRGERRTVVARGAASGLPLVLFESPQRIGRTLRELEEALGDREAVLLRELTKLHEEVRAGTLGALRAWVGSAPPRGEVTLVVAGAPEAAASVADAREIVASLRGSGLSASQTAREAAVLTGLPRSELYALARSVEGSSAVGLESELALSDENALQDALGEEEAPER
jgi:16S rRNA (cytidine1402-2'-O)-methyltransferase